MNIQVTAVDYAIEKTSILHDIHLNIQPGEFVGLIGPNGSGKSTLLKHIYRVLQPNSGTVRLDGQDIFNLSARDTAKKMAVVRQESEVSFDFQVGEIVLMGRTPHKELWQPDTKEDFQIVQGALQQVGLQGYEERSFFSLSGGEKQRVLIARALAQQAKVLILDEPTNHLDIQHQLHVLDLVKCLKLTACAALHDLNLASLYCDRLFVLKEGRVYASGTPVEVLKPEVLWEVYHVHADVFLHPRTGKLHIAFLPDGTPLKPNKIMFGV